MNVAVTRAKRLCVLIGDSGTVSKNAFLSTLCAHFKANGTVRSAFDYEGNPNVRSMYGVKAIAKKPNDIAEETKDTIKKSERQPKIQKAKPSAESKEETKPSAVNEILKKPRLELTAEE